MKMNLTAIVDANKGKPLELALDDVRPAPAQPRTVFEPVAMQELADSIALRGVKMPISVRPDSAAPGKYIINLGERRYLGSKMAGKSTIPAFIDETCTSYDQMVENLQRADLTPLEIANFIAERLAAGEKKGEIAKGIGRPATFVTFHLALIDAPPVLVNAYAAGVTSPQTLYDLRNLYDKQPEAVEAWVEAGADVTRETIKELAERLFHEKISASPEPEMAEKLFHQKISAPAAQTKATPSRAPLAQPKQAPVGVPIMAVHKGRKVFVEPCLVKIMYEGSNDIVEVPLSELSM